MINLKQQLESACEGPSMTCHRIFIFILCRIFVKETCYQIYGGSMQARKKGEHTEKRAFSFCVQRTLEKNR